jgi:hypothetical protein
MISSYEDRMITRRTVSASHYPVTGVSPGRHAASRDFAGALEVQAGKNRTRTWR